MYFCCHPCNNISSGFLRLFENVLYPQKRPINVKVYQPIASPSLKLWRPSPMMTIQAIEEMLVGSLSPPWLWPWPPDPWLWPWSSSKFSSSYKSSLLISTNLRLSSIINKTAYFEHFSFYHIFFSFIILLLCPLFSTQGSLVLMFHLKE